jgi:hypothetical protein
MAQIKRLLGHVALEVADRQRICHRNRRTHKIHKGEACLVVRSGRFESRNYCRACALPMLDQVREDLGSLGVGLAPAKGDAAGGVAQE